MGLQTSVRSGEWARLRLLFSFVGPVVRLEFDLRRRGTEVVSGVASSVTSDGVFGDVGG